MTATAKHATLHRLRAHAKREKCCGHIHHPNAAGYCDDCPDARPQRDLAQVVRENDGPYQTSLPDADDLAWLDPLMPWALLLLVVIVAAAIGLTVWAFDLEIGDALLRRR